MNADGSDDTRLTQNRADDRFPRFSPDGQRIAYSSQSRTGDILPEVWIMNSDGADPRQLTQHGGMHPAWSPDGAEIVFTREDWRTNAPQNGTLWIINVETGREYQLLCKWPEQCQ
jgi:Tol biopolymer transport system component